MKIYLAGPLFTAYERNWNQQLAMELRALGHDVWLPQDWEDRGDRNAVNIFQVDIAALESCEVVVANLDQPDPDSGTCFEVGFAYARKTPVFFYRTDFRTMSEFADNEVNLMLTCAAKRIPVKFGDGAAEVARSINLELQCASFASHV